MGRELPAYNNVKQTFPNCIDISDGDESQIDSGLFVSNQVQLGEDLYWFLFIHTYYKNVPSDHVATNFK